MLETLKKLNIETHLVISEWGEKCISMETDFTINYVKSLATNISDEKNMASSVSSGTHKIDGMIVAPCSMKTLAAIANGYDDMDPHYMARLAQESGYEVDIISLFGILNFFENASSISYIWAVLLRSLIR